VYWILVHAIPGINPYSVGKQRGCARPSSKSDWMTPCQLFDPFEQETWSMGCRLRVENKYNNEASLLFLEYVLAFSIAGSVQEK
jgi:hypothetical protein